MKFNRPTHYGQTLIMEVEKHDYVFTLFFIFRDQFEHGNGQQKLDIKLHKKNSFAGLTKSQDNIRSRWIPERSKTEVEIPTLQISTKILGNFSASQNMNSGTMEGSSTIVKKGLLWCQQEKLFTKWKERFVILTPSCIQIFKKATTRISEMGSFLFTVNLSSIDFLSLEDRRGYMTIVMHSKSQEPGRFLLRKTEGIKEWFSLIQQKHIRVTKSKRIEHKMQSSQKKLEQKTVF